MKDRAIIFASASSGLIGAIVGALLFGATPSAHAAISTSGYYVCGNKTTGALRMANEAGNNCNKSKEYRYFFLADATDIGSSSIQKTATIKFLTADQSFFGGGGNCGYGAAVTYVQDVTFSSTAYRPLTVTSAGLRSCEITVLVP